MAGAFPYGTVCGLSPYPYSAHVRNLHVYASAGEYWGRDTWGEEEDSGKKDDFEGEDGAQRSSKKGRKGR